jgi:hypothetical protein
LLSSISIAEREEEPEGIADVIRCEGNAFQPPIWHTGREKSQLRSIQARKRNFGVKPGLDMRAFHKSLTLETVLRMRRCHNCCHARESGHPVIRDVGIEH